jgi:hypothetical protein
VAHSRNHCCHGNPKLHSLLLLTYLCLCWQFNKYWKGCQWRHSKAFSVLLRYISRCQRYKTHSDLHVHCPIFLSDINQILNFPTGFRKNPQYQISRKSVQWEPRWCMRTGGVKSKFVCRFSRDVFAKFIKNYLFLSTSISLTPLLYGSVLLFADFIYLKHAAIALKL